MTAFCENPSPEAVLPEQFPLRTGLRIHPREGSTQVVLEDTSRAKFYRLGPTEAAFIASLVENDSTEEACLVASRLDVTFTKETATRLCKWLSSNELTGKQGSNASSVAPGQTTPNASTLNPFALAFFWKIPLINPDRWLERFVCYFGWLFSPHCLFAGILCFLWGVLQTTGRWTEFTDSYENLFTSWRGLWLAIAWLILKIIHETAHGATCRRYGGEVHDAGFAMILLMPIAYVNVTSSWRFASRWHRLHVTLAGVAVELFIAGVALIGWNLVDSLPFKQAAADVVLLASVSSLLFNLNPLLKFDGYFALADATGVDNLYSYGQQYARYFGMRYILGLDKDAPLLPGSRPAWIKLYGVSASIYRVFTTAGILVAAAALFKGAGIVIAIAGVFSFILKPTSSLAFYLWHLQKKSELSLVRLAARLGILAALSLGPLWLIPADFSWTSPAIVQYDPPAILRTRVDAFIDEILVRDGDSVTEGETIAIFRNDDLALELHGLRKELAQIEQQILAAQWQADSSKLGDANSRKVGLVERIHEKRDQVDSLILRSPITGRLVARNLHTLQGTYVKAGHELGIVGREDSKRLKISITQYDSKRIDYWIENSLRVVVNGYPKFTAKLLRLDTRANSNPPDDSLLAQFGGALAALHTSNDTLELSEPRVSGYIPLTPEQSLQLRSGQRAHVSIGSSRQSVGDFLFSKLLVQ